MPKALIQIAYRQIIDIASNGAFEQNVWKDSYSEFQIQIQTYNQDNRYKTWEELKADNGKAAFNIPYKVGFSIGLYVKGLNGKMPHLQDSLGRNHIPFANHEFEIVASDITNEQAHVVALTYTSDTLTLFDSIGDHMLLAEGDKTLAGETIDMFSLKMQPHLSIIKYRPL
ncbi:hypothetical protein OCK74_04285 [Chitinophagaceae bacterium LB-8]|uniref:Uncharacterized protein n=1 Tax=Paraflavisolibacter caeni TaxID=2982496 RepID=A0A9X3BGT3_9BACT|nr:hypothetical protein [Paraflavisolibacter caeni]MCU7548317.1 hypothetical protein [Paraflavisolibacter caeni]